MSRSGGTTLYVTGFGQGTRARDLAYEFERYGRLVRCDIPAPRSSTSRLFAFVEYESRRDADEAYYDMHNKRLGRDDILKIEWARTPPSATWRFDAGSGRDRPSRRDRSPRRRSASPPARRSRGDYSPRKDERRERDYDDRRDRDYDDRRERDYDRRDRDRERSRTPDDRDRDRGDREGKEDRDRDDDRDRGRDLEANGDDIKGSPTYNDTRDVIMD
ncbi:MAG: hypothetical protein M1820_007036 [Bogoriella megaspora]|nr:MAG: hypothetical protein M1820_007036 [Bogoriella megaspora]